MLAEIVEVWNKILRDPKTCSIIKKFRTRGSRNEVLLHLSFNSLIIQVIGREKIELKTLWKGLH